MDFILVHAGAGYHSEKKHQLYSKLCTEACSAGLRAIGQTSDPLSAVVAAIRHFEDDPSTNCGTGSNLCVDGTVECDASVMTGSNMRWAGIGCLSGIRNPVLVAERLHAVQGQGKICGLVQPCLMVGEGAKKWALQQNCSEEADLVTESSCNMFHKLNDRVDKTKDQMRPKRQRMDTVGAVAISSDGSTASAVSSGGVLLKVPGRVGQAASYASGCWSEAGVTITTSGTGEQLIKTMLAMKTAQDILNAPDDKIPHELALESFKSRFLESNFLSESQPSKRLAGIVAAFRHPVRNTTEFYCIHNTQSMFYAFLSSEMATAECHMSRLSQEEVKVDFFSLPSKQKDDT